MAKRPIPKSVPAKSSRGTRKIVATLADGVAILAPKSKPKHFTSKEMRATIQELRRNSADGFPAPSKAKRG
jgi:hypothetical protein